MQDTLSNFAVYLQRTNTWLFLTVILLFSYALTQAAGSGSPIVYLRFIGSLSMISAPIIVFASMGLKPGSKTYSVLAVVTFGLFTGGILLYNPTIQDLPFTKYQLEADSFSNLHSVRLLFAAFLLLQGLLWWHHRRVTATLFAGWFRRLNTLRLAVIVVTVFCAGLTFVSNPFQEAVATLSYAGALGSYLLVVVQTFLVYFPYYLIYHVHHHYLFRDLLQERGILHYALGAVALLLIFTPLHAVFASLIPHSSRKHLLYSPSRFYS